MKKAITHIKLDRANLSKIHKLDELAAEHQQVVQAYVDWLIAHEVRQPDKYAAIPETEVSTSLSDRWQRCAWQQACGIVQSWYSNERENKPLLQNTCIQEMPMWSSLSLLAHPILTTGCEYPPWKGIAKRCTGTQSAFPSRSMSGPKRP